MKSQNFELNPARDKSVVAKLTGQAGQVYHAMVELNRPVTGVEVDEHIAKSDNPFVTRQDTLRVTLYYLVVFKSKGLVTGSRGPRVNPAEKLWDDVCAQSANA